MSENVGPFGVPLPQGLVAAIMKNKDHQHMRAQDSIHDVKQFLDSLTEGQLKSLSSVVDTVLSAPHSGYWISGLIDQTLQINFDVCICGENHDPQDLLPKLPVQPNEATDLKGKPIEDVSLPEKDDPEKLAEYGLTYNPQTTYYNCDNCGLQYVSLQDRMLRPPGIDGCGGCQNKSAHG